MNKKVIPLNKSSNLISMYYLKWMMKIILIDELDLKNEYRINNFYGKDWDNFV